MMIGEFSRISHRLSTVTAAGSAQRRHHWPERVSAHLTGPTTTARPGALLEELGFDAGIARKGVPAPVQVGKWWVVERTNSWMNGFGKIRRCTDRNRCTDRKAKTKAIDFYLCLAAALVTVRQFIQRARTLSRWDARPTSRRLK